MWGQSPSQQSQVLQGQIRDTAPMKKMKTYPKEGIARTKSRSHATWRAATSTTPSSASLGTQWGGSLPTVTNRENHKPDRDAAAAATREASQGFNAVSRPRTYLRCPRAGTWGSGSKAAVPLSAAKHVGKRSRGSKRCRYFGVCFEQQKIDTSILNTYNAVFKCKVDNHFF